MNKNVVVKKLLKINNEFYKQNYKDFSLTRNNKNFWRVYEECFKKNNSKYMVDDNRIFVFGNLSQTFNNFKTIKVLDVGSGEGRFYRFLKETYPNIAFKYLGIDNNQELLDVSLEKEKDIKTKLVDITDVANLNNLDSDFDLIVCFSVFHHIPTLELRMSILENLKSKINKSGKLIVTTWDFKNKYSKKIVNPKIVGIDQNDLDENDYILDWNKSSYRYLADVNSL